MTPNIKLGKSPLKLAHIPCSKNEGIWCYSKKKVLKEDKFVFSRNLPIELSGRLHVNLAGVGGLARDRITRLLQSCVKRFESN